MTGRFQPIRMQDLAQPANHWLPPLPVTASVVKIDGLIDSSHNIRQILALTHSLHQNQGGTRGQFRFGIKKIFILKLCVMTIEKQIKSRKDFWNLHPIKLLVYLPVAKWISLLITWNNMYREIAALKLSFKFCESCKLIEQVQTWWK